MEVSNQCAIWLLNTARQSIEYFLETKNFLPIENVKVPTEIETEVARPSGAVVVLEILRSGRKKAQIRGQNGMFEAVESLGKLVSQLAVNAAFFDTHTPRLKAYELNDLKIHVYIPTELKQMPSLDALLTAIDRNSDIGIMVSAYGRFAYDLPVLRDIEESTAHRLRRLRLQIGVARKNADLDVEYCTFEGKHEAEELKN